MHKTASTSTLAKYLLWLLFAFPTLSTVRADYWNLPQKVSPLNTSITFEVDSTWHLIKGTAKDFSGKLWLDNSNDFKSVRGTIRIPISAFDTDNESRDEKMREVMNAVQFPEVEFSITNFDPSQCSPQALVDGVPCQTTLSGDLKINNLTKEVALITLLKKSNDNYQIVGTTTIKWKDFNVEDPSILIAKLYDDVKIQISLSLSSQP